MKYKYDNENYHKNRKALCLNCKYFQSAELPCGIGICLGYGRMHPYNTDYACDSFEEGEYQKPSNGLW